VLAVLLLAAVTGANTARAAAPWEAWTNAGEGFRITIPKDWFLVPNTVARVETQIKQATAKNDAAVAQAYESFIATTAARAKLGRYAFEAFAYSTYPDPIIVTVGIVRTTAANTSAHGLAIISSGEASDARAHGLSVAKAGVVKLHAGEAAYMSGTLPGQSKNTIDFADYAIARGTLLYQVSFTADARIAGAESTFSTIAQLFAFTKLPSSGTTSPSSPSLKA
jgi:hypothetical protein